MLVVVQHHGWNLSTQVFNHITMFTLDEDVVGCTVQQEEVVAVYSSAEVCERGAVSSKLSPVNNIHKLM